MAMFLDGIKEMPLPASVQAAETGLKAWSEAAARQGEGGLAGRAAAITGHPRGGALLRGVFGCSPHLTAEAIRDVAFTCDLLEQGPEAGFAAAIEALRAMPDRPEPGDAVMAALRQAKRRGSLAIAIGDITGMWP